MRPYLFSFLLLLPAIAKAQHDPTVVYKQSYSVKGGDKDIINSYARQFVTKNREKFFYLSSYSKTSIDKSIDTSEYGYIKKAEDSVISPCLFVYIAGSIDIVHGDIVFTGRANEAGMKLVNVYYTKYEKQNGVWRETQRGNYKDLKLCRHCNVAGIKLAEAVNKGFVRLSLSYEQFIKTSLYKGRTKKDNSN